MCRTHRPHFAALACFAFISLLLAAPSAWSADAAEPPLYPIRNGDLHGLINADGKLVLPPEFVEIRRGKPLILARKGNRWAYFDSRGTLVIEPQSELTQPFAEGVTPVQRRDATGRVRFGYVDAAGKVVIEPQFDAAESFIDGLAAVGILDAWGVLKYGAIDRSGKLVVPAQFDKALAPGGGVIRFQNRNQPHRVFAIDGRDITPAGVDFIGIHSEGMVRIWSGRKQGFMTTGGEIVVAPAWDNANDFHDGMARIQVDGKYGYLDRKGSVAIAARFAAAEDFSDGLALVREDGKPFYIDRLGNRIFEPQAERAYPFSEGRAAVRLAGKYGYMDKTGKLVIQAQYGFANAFHQGMAAVSIGRSSAYIRPDGTTAWRSD